MIILKLPSNVSLLGCGNRAQAESNIEGSGQSCEGPEEQLRPTTYLSILRLFNNFRQCFLANILSDFPGGKGMPLGKDLLNFFQRTSDGLWIHKEDVYEGSEVEGAKDKVGLPSDGVETWRNGECESGVECPVGRLDTL